MLKGLPEIDEKKKADFLKAYQDEASAAAAELSAMRSAGGKKVKDKDAAEKASVSAKEAPADGKYSRIARVVTTSADQHLLVSANDAKEPTDIAVPFTIACMGGMFKTLILHQSPCKINFARQPGRLTTQRREVLSVTRMVTLKTNVVKPRLSPWARAHHGPEGVSPVGAAPLTGRILNVLRAIFR